MKTKIAILTAERIELLEKIIKDCFWDYHISPEKIIEIITSNDLRLKKKLFIKIIENSTDKLSALMLFDKQDLVKLFNSLEKTDDGVLVLRNVLLNERNVIAKAQWKKR